MREVVSVCLLALLTLGEAAGFHSRGRVSLETAAMDFLRELNSQGLRECNRLTELMWQHSTDPTIENREAMVTGQQRFAGWQKEAWQKAQVFNTTRHTLPPHLARQLKLISVLGSPALPKTKLEEYSQLKSEMMNIYNTAKICDFRNKTLCEHSLPPDPNDILRSCTNYDELTYVWKTWRDSSGKRIRPLYGRYIQLANDAASLNGFTTMGDLWLSNYGDSTAFAADVQRAYQELQPLYHQLHAYVRRKLREVYGVERVPLRGPIPAHLLGNMWAQQWDKLYSLVQPYPNKRSIDVTDDMKAQGYTPRRMFELADDFYVSLGLPRLPQSFWSNSLIEGNKSSGTGCHPSAWDFCNGKDYRVKMCTEVTMEDLQTVYHEVGHVHYYMQYANLPYLLQGGANKGFHEALGDLLGMIATSPSHLQKVGLLLESKVNQEVEINFLLNMALRKVAFIPFGYLVDLWRWDAFSGKVPQSEWNCGWWKRRVDIQGVSEPVPRTEEDFDPGAKFHVAAGKSYLRYLVSTVLQFQFHKALCQKAGQYHPDDPSRPLHRCDIHASKAAGAALKSMMQMGRSADWREALGKLTGVPTELDASAMREYFKPLELWLVWDNYRHGEHVGWQSEGQGCKPVKPVPG